MRIDSCRRCGENLTTQKECNVCNEVILFSCVKCNYSTEEKLHFQCQVPIIELQSGGR